MPTYDWECGGCRRKTEVFRRMDDSKVPPYAPCQGCGSTQFTKVITAHQVLIPGGDSGKGIWPITVKGLEKKWLTKNGRPVLDAQGIPIQIKADVVFHSKAHQDQWLEQRGMCRMMDGEADSTVHEDSVHSHYHQGDIAPPSDKALSLAEQATFVSSPEEFGTFVEPRNLQPSI